jgi:hypothetical protein
MFNLSGRWAEYQFLTIMFDTELEDRQTSHYKHSFRTLKVSGEVPVILTCFRHLPKQTAREGVQGQDL